MSENVIMMMMMIRILIFVFPCIIIYGFIKNQPDANCLVLLYYTSPALHVSDAIYTHPQERHIMHMQPVHVIARVS